MAIEQQHRAAQTVAVLHQECGRRRSWHRADVHAADVLADVAGVHALAAAEGGFKQVPAPLPGVRRLPDILSSQTGDGLDADLAPLPTFDHRLQRWLIPRFAQHLQGLAAHLLLG